MRGAVGGRHLGPLMFWTASLCLFLLWLLALLLDRGDPWVHALPVVVAALLIYRVVRAAVRR